MKEITFNIHLMKHPSKTSSKGKDQLNKVHLCNRSKDLCVDDAFLFREALSDQTIHVAFNSTVKGKLGFIDP